MNASQKLVIPFAVVLAGAFSLGFPLPVCAEPTAPEKAQALLQDVKKRGLERQIAGKQTDLDRLSEDLTKGQKESDRLQESLESVGNTIKESSAHFEQLTSQRERLSQVLDLVGLRIEAERLKVEGLKLLSDSQSKALAAMGRKNEEINLRATLGAAELKLLQPAELPAISEGKGEAGETNVPKLRSEIPELRKRLEKSEAATASAEKIAREAMLAATRKLQLADSAATRATKKAVDLGVEGGSDASAAVEPLKAKEQP